MGMVRRRVVMWCALALLAVGAPQAQAVPEPVGGCNNDRFTLALVADAANDTYFFVLDRETFPRVESWAAFLDALDANNDGFICWKLGKPNHGHGDARRIFHGDNKFKFHGF